MRAAAALLAALLLLALPACGSCDKCHWSFTSSQSGGSSSGGTTVDIEYYSKTAAENLYSDTW